MEMLIIPAAFVFAYFIPLLGQGLAWIHGKIYGKNITMAEFRLLHPSAPTPPRAKAEKPSGIPRFENPPPPPPLMKNNDCGCKKRDIKEGIFTLIDLISDVDVVDYSFFPSDSHKSRSVKSVKAALKRMVNELDQL